jgi:hypothetical protein
MPIQRISSVSDDQPSNQPMLVVDEEASVETPVSSGNILDVPEQKSRDPIEQISEILLAVRNGSLEEANSLNGEGSFFVRSVPNSIDGGFVLAPGNASMESYAPTTSFPRKRREQLQRVDYWLGNLDNNASGDDLLNNLMRVKVDFTALGLNLRLVTDEEVSTGNKEQGEFKKFLRRMKKKWNWQKIVEDLLQDWFTKDTMILYWKTEKGAEDSSTPPDPRSKEALAPGLIDVCTLNPSDCDWDNSFGNDVLKYKIPKDIEVKIRIALNKTQKARIAAVEALRDAGVDDKYILAVDKGQQYVTLNRQDGDHWLVVTRERNRNGFAKPSMRFVFDALESRKCVKEGEFIAAYMMKHFIFHATCGESITQGALAGLKNNWAKKKDIDQLYNILSGTSKAQRIATNHTVKFNFIFPPKDMWDGAKYEKAEFRIYDFAGVNAIVMTGVGGTNAGGYLGIKRMIAGMGTAREKIEYIIYEFFDDAEIREICQVPDDVDVTATFDENALKEPKQLLDEIKFLLQNGVGDPPSAASELGRDPSAIRDSKLAAIKENSTSKVWEPVYQAPAQGQVGKRQVKQDAKGRPAGDGTTQNEETRQQSARATS